MTARKSAAHADESPADEPKVEEPAAQVEAPKVEEPKVEEPQADEPLPPQDPATVQAVQQLDNDHVIRPEAADRFPEHADVLQELSDERKAQQLALVNGEAKAEQE